MPSTVTAGMPRRTYGACSPRPSGVISPSSWRGRLGSRTSSTPSARSAVSTERTRPAAAMRVVSPPIRIRTGPGAPTPVRTSTACGCSPGGGCRAR